MMSHAASKQHDENDNNDHSLNSIYLKQYVERNAGSVGSQDDTSTVYSAINRSPEEKHRWKQFKRYTIWNSIRFIVIAGIICFSNYHNQIQIEKYRPYCCDCYYVAENPQKYNISEGYRIDWSYCMPACVDCKYCRDHYNNSAAASFNAQESCPADSYHPTKAVFSFDWYEDAECPKTISITSLKYFLKDYRVYGVSTVVIVVLYITLMVSFVKCCRSYAGINSGASLFVYNVIVSINAVYSMFKPMQYYHKTIDNTPNETICEIDTINETTERLITYCVYTSFVFILSQWIIGVIGCLITRKAMISDPSSEVSAGLVPYKIKEIYINFEKAMIVLAVLLAFTFYLALLWASLKMIQLRLEQDTPYQNGWKIAVIIIVDILSIISCFDIFLCKFCRHTTSNYFRRSTNPQSGQLTYRQLWGGSPEEHNDAYSLQNLQDDSEREVTL